MQELSTAREIMEKLDGADGIARLTGSKPKAVLNWKYFNRFPSRTFLVLNEALREKGFRAPASLWGMAESDRMAS